MSMFNVGAGGGARVYNRRPAARLNHTYTCICECQSHSDAVACSGQLCVYTRVYFSPALRACVRP